MNDDSGNGLELALAKAATEPAHRPEFYRLLLESQVLVLGHVKAAYLCLMHDPSIQETPSPSSSATGSAA